MAKKSAKKQGNVADLTKDGLLKLYQSMVKIRVVELKLSRLFADSEVPGFIHLSVGQEGIAAGIGANLKDIDTAASTHRGHGHALVKGISLDEFFSELMAKEEGICKGRGGSMHVASFATGMLGANAIVGASVPIAVGSSLAHQVTKNGAIAVAFFGDGAMAQGALHESLNMASLWKLPILFVCENNGWSEFSPTDQQFAAALEKLSKAFDIPYKKVNGNHVQEVYEESRSAIEDVRSGKGPFVLECSTMRWRGHYEGDAQRYRDSAEFDLLGENDPLKLFEVVLQKNGVNESEIEEIRTQVNAAVDKAVERAREGIEPSWDDAKNEVYAKIN